MKLYDVDGYDRPLRLSEEHAQLLGATEHEGVLIAPTKSASKAEWVEYAVAQGADPAIAGELTRAELIAQHGA